MKRTILLMLTIVMTTMAMAEDVTPEQALEQARNFVQKREATGSRKVRRAPGATAPKLTMTARKVSGLYVFNIADGGFVVVSGDDRTTPILGFSDSGNLDPEQMPENMKAWLQGYADEIAWLEQRGTTTVIVSKNSNGPRRVGNHSTTAIDPLVQTRWNQGAPYNGLCPEYATGRNSVTGCVATAMAQVMKYHEWPTAATTTIPGYTTRTYALPLSELPAVTFNWADMQNSYSSNATGAAATAVATLMKYCGWSVQMDYGPSSGSNSSKVADALKDYFDYNTTAQVVSRSFYTSAKWADLIYHELASGRPVVYGGQSSGGGHSFVCDGYKFESGTDFFHINWGWGGMSDNYFVLSALDPDAQGIGGSTSNDGFHYGQDAVIGIQKSTANGTVANITPNVINLRMNSMTLSKYEVTVNTEVTVTMNITNNSTDDYEGDIYLGLKKSNGYSLLEGNNFNIPSGQTVNCVIPFTPTEKGTYEFVFFWPNDKGSYTTNTQVYATLDVVDYLKPYNIAVTPRTTSANVSWTGNENATNYNVRYGSLPGGGTPSTLQYDNGTYNKQTIGIGRQFYWAVKFPGGTYAGQKLTKVSTYDAAAISSTVSIYNGDATTSQNLVGTKDITLTGAHKFVDFKFDTPLDIDQTKDLWIVFYFGGTSSPAAVCEDTTPNDVNNSLISANGTQWTDLGNVGAAGLGWMIRGYMDTYDESDINWIATVSSNSESCLLTNLAPETNYKVRVQSVYNGGNSAWSELTSFTTLPLVELGDEATNNGAKIAADNGKTTSVTLAGRTLYKDGNWNTICLPFDVTLADSPLAGAIARTLTDATMTGTYVTLNFGDAVTTLKAGTPYIIKWEGGEDLVEPVFNDVTISALDGATIEKADGHVKFTGYYDAFDIDTPANDDIYYLAADNMLRHTAKKRTLRACRAYFQFSENIVGSARQFILDFGDGQTTSIDNLMDSPSEASEADVWYSIDGIRLDSKPTKKGFYIHNGKKEVVK